MAGRADRLVVLEPGVCGGRDALLVPTAQLHHGACHCATGDFTGRGVWGHWRGGRGKIHRNMSKNLEKKPPPERFSHFSFLLFVPRTLRVTLVSPRLTESKGALISQRYSPASSWVTLCSVTVAPSMVARPSKGPERKDGKLLRTYSFNTIEAIFFYPQQIVLL